MQKKSTLKSLAVLAALLSTSAFAQTAAVVKIDGSSTVYPITEVAAEEFQINTKNKIKVTVGISGTGVAFLFGGLIQILFSNQSKLCCNDNRNKE